MGVELYVATAVTMEMDGSGGLIWRWRSAALDEIFSLLMLCPDLRKKRERGAPVMEALDAQKKGMGRKKEMGEVAALTEWGCTGAIDLAGDEVRWGNELKRCREDVGLAGGEMVAIGSPAGVAAACEDSAEGDGDGEGTQARAAAAMGSPAWFRNELPDPTAQPKLLSLNANKDQYTKYTITSLEKMHKPKLFVEPDLGIPLDLLDISVYNPPSIRQPLALEDEELLRDSESVTPVKQDGIKRKERPTDKGVSWLVKTQYISPLSMDAAKQSLTEKQAKELRETRGGHNLLENLNDREKQIQAIEASFEACKSRPVHATNDSLQPVEILPLLPDFDRFNDQFVMAAFDGDPTADSEIYSKLDKSVRDVHESQASYLK
ncbi:hypothetical protein HHK36_016369 [Tetracentron sinense]|uniref:RNA polymerase II-associated factor 1 homolog n=1 Tax=Tetracentron sinense TaxID=13715 RepID=A0A834Z073_TETSI|nr:hypothetical protein HHK36_016369 [Tetracentron sinense]